MNKPMFTLDEATDVLLQCDKIKKSVEKLEQHAYDSMRHHKIRLVEENDDEPDRGN